MNADLFGYCGCGSPLEVPGRDLCFACYCHQQDRGDDNIVGLKVKLARDIDREKTCHDNLAIIHPGRAQHAGELRCAVCGAHRGWLSQTVHSFISETVRRFGAPAEPIVVRQQEKREMAFERKDNSGSVFVNDHKSDEKDPDRSGTALIGGVEYWVNGWLRKTKKGQPYLSLSFKPKNATANQPRAPIADDLNDALPF